MNSLISNSSNEVAMQWDPPEVIFLKLLAIFGLVLMNSFFVASEFSIVKVRSSQLETLLDGGRRAAREAKKVISKLDAYLSATQLGITLASLGLGWIGEPFLAAMIEPLLLKTGIQSPTIIHSVSISLGLLIITVLHIVLGEMAPKSVAIRKALPTALFVSQPLQWFYIPFSPFIRLLNGMSNAFLKYILRIQPVEEFELAHSEEELRVILSESEKSREVSSMGKKILINALDLRRRVVRDIMTPRGNVVYLDVEESFQHEVQRAIQSRHTRFPLCRGHLDDAFGLVHIKDLLALSPLRGLLDRENQPVDSEKLLQETAEAGQPPDLMAIRRDLLHVAEMMPLEKLLPLFLSKHAHLAVVVDEYGGAVGIVTLDNVLEELVGSIQDEFDTTEQEFQKINEHEFTVEGTLALYELAAMLHVNFGSPDVSTIGGYLTVELGHIPLKGESIRIGHYTATVTETDGRRVLRVHLKKQVTEPNSNTTETL